MEVCRKALGAGFLIGLAAGVFTGIQDRVLGAFLFSFGLFYVCILKEDLFTGKIGWLLADEQPWWYYPLILIWNLAGTFIAACLLLAANPGLREQAAILIENKLALSLWQVFMKGILCGVMMYLAVVCYRQQSGLKGCLGVFLCVPIFILSGFEHSIADAGYMFLAMDFRFWLSLLVIALGNGVGSILARFLLEGPWEAPVKRPQAARNSEE